MTKPIIFNTEMVKAILDKRKTQTRRVINLINKDLIFTGFIVNSTDKKREGCCSFGINKERDLEYVKPRYKVGDILYVREPSKVINSNDDKYMEFVYLADNKKSKIEYPARFAIELPKWIFKCQGVQNACIKEMARIFLKVTNVRIEKLQDITKKDVLAEGIIEHAVNQFNPYTCLFKAIWNSTAEDGYKWEDNPYVFVYEFERI